MNLTPPLVSDVVIPMDVTASNVTVVIPDTVPVEVQGGHDLGQPQRTASQNHGGMTNQQSDYNTDKPGADLVLEIDGTYQQHHHPGRKLT